MDDSVRRDNQLIVAATFFRNLVAEDAAGLDVGLANLLLDTLANAGTAPDVIQYSCWTDRSERAAGRFLFGWTPQRLASHGGPVDAEDVHRSLTSLCEFSNPGGAEGLVALSPAPAVRCVWLGFDARVVPEDTRVRLAFTLQPGEHGRRLVERIYTGLGLPADRARAADAVTEVAVDHGPGGLADVRLAWRVAPRAVANSPVVTSDPTAVMLAGGAGGVRLVRSLREPQEARLLFLSGSPDVAEEKLTTLGSRSTLLADLRRESRVAARALPVDASMTVHPMGFSMGVTEGRPTPDRIAVLFRPATRR